MIQEKKICSNCDKEIFLHNQPNNKWLKNGKKVICITCKVLYFSKNKTNYIQEIAKKSMRDKMKVDLQERKKILPLIS